MTPTLLRPLQSAAAVALALLPALAGCGVTHKKFPVEQVVQANTERDFWWALRSVVQELDYPVSPTGADESGRALTSQWKESAAPFRGGPNSIDRRSYRTRVIAKYKKLRSGQLGEVDPNELPKGGIDVDLESYRVSIRVEREFNNSLRPMDARYADWRPADDDERVAQQIVFSLGLKLGGDSFRLQGDPERDRVLRSVGR